MLDHEVIGKFKEFQKKTGKYLDLVIEDVRFEKVTIEDIIIKFIKGATPKYSIEKTNTIVIKSGQARGDYNNFNFKKVAYLDLVKVQIPKYLHKGDILINTTGIGTAGRVTLFDLDGSYVSDSHITVLRYDLSKIDKLYLLNFFKNFGYKKLESMAEGSGGQVELSMSNVKSILIPMPTDLNKKYTSYNLQKIIVEFLEHGFNWLDDIKANIDKQHSIYTRLRKALIPSTFKKDFIKIRFAKYAKKHDIHFNITDVEFEIKRIHTDKENKDDLICNKSMGFTPKTDINGDINWFSVKDLGQVNGLFINNPNTNKKTTMKLIKESVDKKNTGKSEKLIPIKKGNILISFKLTVGVVKVYNSDEPAYCNEAIDILTVNDDISSEYVAYNCILEYPKYGTRTNNGVTLNDDSKKEIKIFIPKPLDKYTSLEIQKIIADFINEVDGEIQQSFDKMEKAYDGVVRYKRAYLARTFSLIDWSK